MLKYSLSYNDQVSRSGILFINTLDESDHTVKVNDDYNENRAAAITPILSGGPEFDFGATYNNITNKIRVTYRHGFAGNVQLKVVVDSSWSAF
jgi:hypothetical protein